MVGGLVGVRHLLAPGPSKVLIFGAQNSLIGVRVSGLRNLLSEFWGSLSKVLSFGAQISLIGVSKLSKSRIQVVGEWIVVTWTRKP